MSVPKMAGEAGATLASHGHRFVHLLVLFCFHLPPCFTGVIEIWRDGRREQEGEGALVGSPAGVMSLILWVNACQQEAGLTKINEAQAEMREAQFWPMPASNIV